MHKPWQLLILFAGLAVPELGQAQGYPVTGGEHPGFTRVVVHAPPGIDWSLSNDGGEPMLSVAPARAGYDLTRLFERIGRTRLANANSDGGELSLELGCDCPVSAWEERPGLIVLDISDPSTAEEPVNHAAESQEAPATRPMTPSERRTAPVPDNTVELSSQIARSVGAALARSHGEAAPDSGLGPPLPDRDALLQSLGLPLAHALSQGLLEPAGDPESVRPLLATASPPSTELPANLRVSTVTDRPDPDRPPAIEDVRDCPDAEALRFLTETRVEPFGRAFARLSRQLYGEFDQPDTVAHRGLVELYLASGFGAEARRLIDANPQPVVGRDLLLGVADVLEDRNSNSRMRLAGAFDCGGSAAVFGLLAGSARSTVPGAALALTFTQLPARLRAVIGADFADRLIAAGELDAARIVAESLRRSAWFDSTDAALVDAALARARGDNAAAAARLQQLAPGAADSQTVLRRLELALEADQPVDAEYLSSVEALASTERGNSTGTALMVTLIRLQARDGSLDSAFDALDRLAEWLPNSVGNSRLISDLADLLWSTLAERGTDLQLVSEILARRDWRKPERTAETRIALAERLVDLGVAPPVSDLIPSPRSEIEAILSARAALALNRPADAIAVLAPHTGVAARATLAAAQEASGRPEAAARTYASLGAFEAAARAAIVARDWHRLREIEAMIEPEALGPGTGDLSALLGRAPGQSGMSRRALPPEDPSSGSLAAPGVNGDRSAPGPEPAQGSGPGQEAGPPPATPGDGRDASRQTHARPWPERDAPATDVPLSFDRLGLVSRGEVLLSESASLRAAIVPLLEPVP